MTNVYFFFFSQQTGTLVVFFGMGALGGKLNDPDANVLKLRKKTLLLFGGGVKGGRNTKVIPVF